MQTPRRDRQVGPLTGIRVLDLTQILAGPFCTMLLADMGADVIKVENPNGGDQTRSSWGFAVKGRDSRAFLAVNRNKRSVRLDLKSEHGLHQFYELARSSDIVIESWRPGVARRLKVDYDHLHGMNPRLIYASISGFGQSGPYSERPGYDLVAQAMGGLMSVSGSSDEPGKSAIPVGDLGAGLYCATGILAAYIERLGSGEGQYVETSLFDAIVTMSIWESTEFWATGEAPHALGTVNRMAAPYQALKTRDGHIAVGANNDRLWRQFCGALELAELVADPRFLTNDRRLKGREELTKLLEERLTTRDTESWVASLLAAGVPVGAIRDYSYVLLGDPHVVARNLVKEVDHPLEGTLKVLGPALKFSRTPASVRTPPPLLGEHDEEILNSLDLDRADPSA